MEQLGSHWTDISDIWYLRISRNSVEKIQLSLKYDANNATLHEDLSSTLLIISRWILLKKENFSDKSCRENQNTILRSIFFFCRKSCRLWDNVEKYAIAGQATDDNMIRSMRIACWITKARHTLRIWSNTCCFSTTRMVTRTRHDVTFIRTFHIACLVFVSRQQYWRSQMTCMCVGRPYWTRAGFLPRHTVLTTSKWHPYERLFFILSAVGVAQSISWPRNGLDDRAIAV